MTKETAIGIAVAVLFVAALWFGLPLLHSWNGSGSEPGAISAGFVGQKQFGQWVLNCPSQQAVAQNNSTPPTFSLMPGHGSPFPSAPGAAAPSNGESALGRCRVALPYFNRTNHKQVVMILSFRSITAKKLLAMVLRFPPLAKKGDTVAIRAGKTEFPLSVQQCGAEICVAVRTLAARGESLLLSNKDGIIVFPAGADGKQRAAKLPLEGAASALAAMRRAES